MAPLDRNSQYLLGTIPGTNLPSIIDIRKMVNFHTAILGITGAGKSFITRELIRQTTKEIKVICVDFTGEYASELADQDPFEIIGKDKLKEKVESEEKLDEKKALEFLEKKIGEFVSSEKSIALFELPELSNSSYILSFTQIFLDSVFNHAKSNLESNFCIVVEEAHTVIPEQNFLGVNDWDAKAVVSKIGQIALQGRKYGVGFLIVAQRTAVVSKTVLTQCNSIISFQAFDQTSFSFLENYFGPDLLKSLPNLKPYHAIVSGKAFKSTVPMIIDMTRDNQKTDGRAHSV